MEKLKKLLKLDIIGWLLILLSLLDICNNPLCVKAGVALILINKLCCALGIKCPGCDKSCSKG